MIRAWWQRARDEWRASRRLRIAGLVALAFVAFHLLAALERAREASADQYRNDMELQARLEGMRGQKAWQGRATRAQAALETMRERMPEVTGAGLAQAELQSWLGDLSTQSALTESRIRVEDAIDVPDHPDLWQVVARLDAQVPQYGDAALLRALSTGLPWIQVERLEIGEGTPARLGLVVRGYYRRAVPGAPAAAASPDASPAPPPAEPTP